MCALLVLGCGDERAPWSGFPIFPPDAGGFELSPNVASGLLAAQAAFARQIAEQGAPDAGHAATGATNPVGIRRASAGAAAPKPQSDDNDRNDERDDAEADAPDMNADSGPAAKPDDSGESAMPDRGASMAPVDAGAAAEGDMTMQQPVAEPAVDSGVVTPVDVADAGAVMPSPGSEQQEDAGVPMPAAGSLAPTPSADAGMPEPAAGTAAPPPTLDAGAPTTDADGGT